VTLKVEPDKLTPGYRIGNYAIIEKIGAGGHATVYRAEQVNLKRNVALKVISGKFSKDNEYLEMFVREAHAMAQLQHPYILQAYDAGTSEDGLSYLSMELIEGGNLQEILAQNNELTLSRILDIMMKISDALSYGQKKMQLTHGDIKPANIMLDFDGEPRLADFGLSESFFHTAKRDHDKVYGTPLYVSPETISGNRAPWDFKADIYSFGCMMHHLIANEPPFMAKNLKDLIFKHMRKTAPELNMLMPEIPIRLSNLVSSMQAKKPYERPNSWQEINHTIKNIIEEMEHPIRFTLKRHWRYAFEYTEKEMIILLFILSSILLIMQPWIGSTLLIFLSVTHYLIHSQKDNTPDDNENFHK
jgi:eukaryotic-like serine/threonine-protein kinase